MNEELLNLRYFLKNYGFQGFFIPSVLDKVKEVCIECNFKLKFKDNNLFFIDEFFNRMIVLNLNELHRMNSFIKYLNNDTPIHILFINLVDRLKRFIYEQVLYSKGMRDYTLLYWTRINE